MSFLVLKILTSWDVVRDVDDLIMSEY